MLPTSEKLTHTHTHTHTLQCSAASVTGSHYYKLDQSVLCALLYIPWCTKVPINDWKGGLFHILISYNYHKIILFIKKNFVAKKLINFNFELQ